MRAKLIGVGLACIMLALLVRMWPIPMTILSLVAYSLLCQATLLNAAIVMMTNAKVDGMIGSEMSFFTGARTRSIFTIILAICLWRLCLRRKYDPDATAQKSPELRYD